ncbi:MAG: hypothetical protein ACP5OE_09790, partial [Thermodesulfobium sp.]
GANTYTRQGQGIKQEVDDSSQKHLAWEAGKNAITSTFQGVKDAPIDTINYVSNTISSVLEPPKAMPINPDVASPQTHIAQENNVRNSFSPQVPETHKSATVNQGKKNLDSLISREAASAEVRQAKPKRQPRDVRKDSTSSEEEKPSPPSSSQIKQKS